MFSREMLDSAPHFPYYLVDKKEDTEERAVATILQPSLFSWQDVDALSDLNRLTLVLNVLPDEDLVATLEAERGRGRNTYPVRPTWNAMIAGVVFQHPSVESLLRELRRNAELRQMCGFNPIFGEAAVPSAWAMTRFIGNVIKHEDLVKQMFERLVERLIELIPDLGTRLAFDGKAIPSHSTGSKSRTSGKTTDPDAAWGIKTYRGQKADGTKWSKKVSWFGYQLHLIVDAVHEVPLAWEIMPANASETKRLPELVNSMCELHPTVAERAEILSADRGLDCAEINRTLLDDHGIKPVIDTRAMWRDEKSEQGRDLSQPITRPLDPDRADNIVYDERGTVYCCCPVTGELRQMACRGFEQDRNVLGYRCPAAVHGFVCKGSLQCQMEALGRQTSYGRLVRVNLDTDRRIFTPIPRDTPQWKREYAKRTSVERVNSRIDQVLGFENHTIRGLNKMRTRMGIALALMLAMAVGHIVQGRHDQMRSFVGFRQPAAKAA